MTNTFRQINLHILAVIVAFIMIGPLIWMILLSIRETHSLSVILTQPIPPHPTFANFVYLFKYAKFTRWVLNSTLYASLTTAGILLFDSLAGYAFAKKEFWGRDTIFLVFLASLMVPFQILVIPLFLLMKNFGFINTYQGLILPGMFSVFGVFLMRQFMISIPQSLIDAARIDGCGEFGIWYKIVMPLCKPALATLAIFTFMGVWNTFLWPLIIATSEKMMPLTVGLVTFRGKNLTNWGLVMAGAVICVAPILVVFLALQRQFVRGIVLSGLKI